MLIAILVDVGLFVLSVIGGAATREGTANFYFMLLCFSTMLVFSFLLIAYIVQKIAKYNEPDEREARREAREARQVKKEEEAAARQEIARKQAAQRVEKQKERYDRLYAQGKIIVEVKLLGAGMTVQKSGGLGGFVVGSMIAGPVGGAIGASAKRNFYQRERFAVKYSDGHVEIEEVVQDSNRYKELMKYVKWEDIQ